MLDELCRPPREHLFPVEVSKDAFKFNKQSSAKICKWLLAIAKACDCNNADEESLKLIDMISNEDVWFKRKNGHSTYECFSTNTSADRKRIKVLIPYQFNPSSSSSSSRLSTSDLFDKLVEGQLQNLSAEQQFTILARIRYCQSLDSTKSRTLAVEYRLRAFAILMYTCNTHPSVSEYIQRTGDEFREILELILPRNRNIVCMSIQLQALNVFLAFMIDHCEPSSGRGARRRNTSITISQYLDLSSVLGIVRGCSQGVLPCLLRCAHAELFDLLTTSDSSSNSHNHLQVTKPSLSSSDENELMEMTLGVAFVEATNTSAVSDTNMSNNNTNSALEIVKRPPLSNKNNKVLWIEAVFFLGYLSVSVAHGIYMLTDSGIIPGLLELIAGDNKRRFSCTLTQCIALLDSILGGGKDVNIRRNVGAAAQILFRDLNGVEIVICRLKKEIDEVVEAIQMETGESIKVEKQKHDEDDEEEEKASSKEEDGEPKESGDKKDTDASVELIEPERANVRKYRISRTQHILILSLINLLESSLHSPAISPSGGGKELKDGVLDKLFQTIYDEVHCFGSVIFNHISIIIGNIINANPTSVNFVHSSGLGNAYLRTITASIATASSPNNNYFSAPTIDDKSKAMGVNNNPTQLLLALPGTLLGIPSVLSSLGLNAAGANVLIKHRIFDSILKVFVSRQVYDSMPHIFDIGIASTIGPGLDELLHHVPLLLPQSVDAMIDAIDSILKWSRQSGLVTEKDYKAMLKFVFNIGEILVELLQNSDYTSLFCKSDGASKLLALYSVIIPSTRSFICQMTIDSSKKNNILRRSLSHIPVATVLTAVFSVLAEQTGSSLLPAVLTHLETEMGILAQFHLSLLQSLSSERDGDVKMEMNEPFLRPIQLLEISSNKPLVLNNSSNAGNMDILDEQSVQIADYMRQLIVIDWMVSLLCTICQGTYLPHQGFKETLHILAKESSRKIISKLFTLIRSVIWELSFEVLLVLNSDKESAETPSKPTSKTQLSLREITNALLLQFSTNGLQLFTVFGCTFFSDLSTANLKTITLTKDSVVVLSDWMCDVLEEFLTVCENDFTEVNGNTCRHINRFLQCIVNNVNVLLCNDVSKSMNCVLISKLVEKNNGRVVDMLMKAVDSLLRIKFYETRALSKTEKNPNLSTLTATITLRILSSIKALKSGNSNKKLKAIVSNPEKIATKLHLRVLQLVLSFWDNKKEKEEIRQLPILALCPFIAAIVVLLVERVDFKQSSSSSISAAASATTSVSEFVVDQEIVENLIAMGFTRPRIEHAMGIVAENSVEMVLEYLVNSDDVAEESQGEGVVVVDLEEESTAVSAPVEEENTIESPPSSFGGTSEDSNDNNVVENEQAEESKSSDVIMKSPIVDSTSVEEVEEENMGAITELYNHLRCSLITSLFKIVEHKNIHMIEDKTKDGALESIRDVRLLNILVAHMYIKMSRTSKQDSKLIKDLICETISTIHSSYYGKNVVKVMDDTNSIHKDRKLVGVLEVFSLLVKINLEMRISVFQENQEAIEALVDIVSRTTSEWNRTDHSGNNTISGSLVDSLPSFVSSILLILDSFALVTPSHKDIGAMFTQNTDAPVISCLLTQRQVLLLVQACVDVISGCIGRYNTLTNDNRCSELNQYPSRTALLLQANFQLLARLTRDREACRRFMSLEGLKKICLLSDRCEFKGFTALLTIIIRHLYEEDIDTLQMNMERDLLKTVVGLERRYGNVLERRITCKMLFSSVRDMFLRDPVVFSRVVSKLIIVKKTAGREYILYKKKKKKSSSGDDGGDGGGRGSMENESMSSRDTTSCSNIQMQVFELLKNRLVELERGSIEERAKKNIYAVDSEAILGIMSSLMDKFPSFAALFYHASTIVDTGLEEVDEEESKTCSSSLVHTIIHTILPCKDVKDKLLGTLSISSPNPLASYRKRVVVDCLNLLFKFCQSSTTTAIEEYCALHTSIYTSTKSINSCKITLKILLGCISDVLTHQKTPLSIIQLNSWMDLLYYLVTTSKSGKRHRNSFNWNVLKALVDLRVTDMLEQVLSSEVVNVKNPMVGFLCLMTVKKLEVFTRGSVITKLSLMSAIKNKTYKRESSNSSNNKRSGLMIEAADSSEAGGVEEEGEVVGDASSSNIPIAPVAVDDANTTSNTSTTSVAPFESNTSMIVEPINGSESEEDDTEGGVVLMNEVSLDDDDDDDDDEDDDGDDGDILMHEDDEDDEDHEEDEENEEDNEEDEDSFEIVDSNGWEGMEEDEDEEDDEDEELQAFGNVRIQMNRHFDNEEEDEEEDADEEEHISHQLVSSEHLNPSADAAENFFGGIMEHRSRNNNPNHPSTGSSMTIHGLHGFMRQQEGDDTGLGSGSRVSLLRSLEGQLSELTRAYESALGGRIQIVSSGNGRNMRRHHHSNYQDTLERGSRGRSRNMMNMLLTESNLGSGNAGGHHRLASASGDQHTIMGPFRISPTSCETRRARRTGDGRGHSNNNIVNRHDLFRLARPVEHPLLSMSIDSANIFHNRSNSNSSNDSPNDPHSSDALLLNNSRPLNSIGVVNVFSDAYATSGRIGEDAEVYYSHQEEEGREDSSRRQEGSDQSLGRYYAASSGSRGGTSRTNRMNNIQSTLNRLDSNSLWTYDGRVSEEGGFMDGFIEWATRLCREEEEEEEEKTEEEAPSATPPAVVIVEEEEEEETANSTASPSAVDATAAAVIEEANVTVQEEEEQSVSVINTSPSTTNTTDIDSNGIEVATQDHVTQGSSSVIEEVEEGQGDISIIPPPAPLTTVSAPTEAPIVEPSIVVETRDLMDFSLDLGSGSTPMPENEENNSNNTRITVESLTNASQDQDVATGAATSEEGTGIQCPAGMDPEVFAALPIEMQQEVVDSFNAEVASTSVSTSAATTTPVTEPTATTIGTNSNEEAEEPSAIDPETLAALPPDIREEVLAQERRDRQRSREAAAAAAAGNDSASTAQAQEMDNASFLASLAPDLRDEVLISQDEAFINTLPIALQQEAQVLRSRANYRSLRQDLHRQTASSSSNQGVMEFLGTSLGPSVVGINRDGVITGRMRTSANGAIRGSRGGQNASHTRLSNGEFVSISKENYTKVIVEREDAEKDELISFKSIVLLIRLLYYCNRRSLATEEEEEVDDDEEESSNILCGVSDLLFNLSKHHLKSRRRILKVLFSILSSVEEKESDGCLYDELLEEGDEERALVKGLHIEDSDSTSSSSSSVLELKHVNNLPSCAAIRIIDMLERLIEFGSSCKLYFLQDCAVAFVKSKSLLPIEDLGSLSLRSSSSSGSCKTSMAALSIASTSENITPNPNNSVDHKKNRISGLIFLLKARYFSKNESHMLRLLKLIKAILLPLDRLPFLDITDHLVDVYNMGNEEMETSNNAVIGMEMKEEEEETKTQPDNTSSSTGSSMITSTDKKIQADFIDIPKPIISLESIEVLVSILSLEICSSNLDILRCISLIIKYICKVLENKDRCISILIEKAKELALQATFDMNELLKLLSSNNSNTINTNNNRHNAILSRVLSSGNVVDSRLLCVLQTLNRLCTRCTTGGGGDGEEEDLTKKQTRYHPSTAFSICCMQIQLEPLWTAQSLCLSSMTKQEGLMSEMSNHAVDNNTSSNNNNNSAATVIKGKTAGASTLMASLLARFLPSIETFFIVNGNNVALESHDSSSTTTSKLVPSPLRQVSAEKIKDLVLFVEQNRVLLNTLVRENCGLLETSLSPLVQVSRCRTHLAFDNKRNYFSAHLRKLRQTASRRHGGSIRLQVRRDQVFEDSFNSLRMRTGEEMRGKFHITFYREEGIDAGGLTREWYMILSREIFNPNYALFTSALDCPTFQPNPLSFVNKDHLEYFKFVGRIIGKAIADGFLLDCHFTRSFYKHILLIPISYHDIEAIDPGYYKSLRSLLDFSIQDIGLDDLMFTVESSNFGKHTTVELKPNGKNIKVTDETKMEYVKLVTHHRMTIAIKDQIDAFLTGFHELVPPHLISIFNENELELLISGMPEIDIDDLKANTEYNNYKPSDKKIQWFWNILYGFTHEERALFIQFVTGTSKVPLEGFKSLKGMRGIQKFNIHKGFGGSKKTLPSAHTWYVCALIYIYIVLCFNDYLFLI